MTVDPAQHVGAQAAFLLIAPAPAGFFGANDLDPLSLTCDRCECPLRGTRPSAGEVVNDGTGSRAAGWLCKKIYAMGRQDRLARVYPVLMQAGKI